MIRLSSPIATNLRRAGFTLMELLVVVAILLVLVGASVPFYMNYLESSKLKVTRTEAIRLSGELQNFAISHQDHFPPTGYPPPATGFAVLVGEGFLKEEPLDPWKRPYQWSLTPMGLSYRPVVWSMGPNGQSGDEDDISSQ